MAMRQIEASDYSPKPPGKQHRVANKIREVVTAGNVGYRHSCVAGEKRKFQIDSIP